MSRSHLTRRTAVRGGAPRPTAVHVYVYGFVENLDPGSEGVVVNVFVRLRGWPE
jgi:hypothetical protein